jgi:hypothetical protein
MPLTLVLEHCPDNHHYRNAGDDESSQQLEREQYAHDQDSARKLIVCQHLTAFRLPYSHYDRRMPVIRSEG